MRSNQHQGSPNVSANNGGVPALVIHLQTELHTLMTHNNEIRRRIHDIRRVVRGLQQIATSPPLDHLPATPHSSCAAQVEYHLPRPDASASTRPPKRAITSLQRACRIALMETEAAASLDEIYARILQRGSFPFVRQERAKSILLRVLRVMAQDGEVRLLRGAPCCRWERIPLIREDAYTRLLHPPAPDMQAGMQYPAQERQ
jgi:hypothetical protein